MRRLISAAKRLLRVAKALAFDPRFPRPLRWAIRVALAIKLLPVPDLGSDEIILVAVGVILWAFYRPELMSVIEESRDG